ncbi:MAG: DUF2207 domain-containing protein [Lachnospiraceae bacterium]|nr:DUF2207 domain-containing protein [Lachnospiraceae bacterium]
MKLKGIVVGVIFAAVLMFLPQNIFADLSVSKMDIYVELNDDGSADVTQYWSTYANEGDEFSIRYSNNGFLEFSDLYVTDKSGSYFPVTEWNHDDGFTQKAYKCGIVNDEEGCDICFGISEYGVNDYTISFKIANLVGSYYDADGFLFRFVNSEMSDMYPTTVTCHISTGHARTFDKSVCDVRQYGFEGTYAIEDGVIVVKTTNDLFYDSNFTVIVKFNKSLFSSSKLYSHGKDVFIDYYDFIEADKDYLDAYFNDYFEKDTSGLWVVAITIIIMVLAVFGGISLFNLYRNHKIKVFYENAPVQEKKASKGNINAVYVLAKQIGLCEEGVLLGARLLSLINSGVVKATLSDLHSDKLRLELFPDKIGENDLDRKLFELLRVAADGDNLLQPRELKRYGAEHFEDIEHYLADCEDDAMAYLKEKGFVKKNVYIGLESLTERGKKELREICGLQKFIKNYENCAKKEGEKCDWKSLLPYAVLFSLTAEFEAGIQEEYSEEYYENEVEPIMEYAKYAYAYYGQVVESMEGNTTVVPGSGVILE